MLKMFGLDKVDATGKAKAKGKGKAKNGKGNNPDGNGKTNVGEGQERAARRLLHLLQGLWPQAAKLLGQGARQLFRQHCRV